MRLDEKRTQKPNILIFSPYYLPGFRAGGPIKSISNLTENLSNYFNFKIITQGHDLGSKIEYSDIILNQWNTIGKAEVYYLKRKFKLKQAIKIIKETDFDLVYLNSFFNPKMTIFPSIIICVFFKKARVLIAPRGEFSKGALSLKPIKKTLFILTFRLLQIHKRFIWHASTHLEKKDIEFVFNDRINIKVAPNLISMSTDLSKQLMYSEKQKGELKIIFISRIDKKKNLIGSLKILQRVQSRVYFNIYGPIENKSYWTNCQRLIAKLPQNVQVSYKSIAHPESIGKLFSVHELFLFPTFGENFGHIIFESLQAGCPVLVSNQTPWKNLEDYKAGYDLPLNDYLVFANKIDFLAGLSNDEFANWRKGSLRYAKAYVEKGTDIKKNLKLFYDSIEGK